MYELKVYMGAMCHDNENDAKFEEELTCQFKIDMRISINFESRTQKLSKIYNLVGCFWSKYLLFLVKKYKGVMLDGTEDWCKIWMKTDLGFEKLCEELTNFHRLKNSDFILESKMKLNQMKLNQNENWKQLDEPDAEWKLTCLANKWIVQLTKLFTNHQVR